MLDWLKEPGSFGGVVPELMTEDPKGPRGVPEAAGDLVGRHLLDQEAAQRFVLPLQGRLRGQEERGIGGGRR
jgi:hypothetical protein